MIVHLITSLDVGGAELVLANLLAGLDEGERKNHRVISLVSAGPVAEKIRALGVKVGSLNMAPGRPAPAALWRLVKDLHTTPGWHLHGWMYHANLMATLACLFCFNPRNHVWSVRNSLTRMQEEKPMTRAIIRLGAWLSFLPRVILYAATSSAEQHEHLGYCKSSRKIIPNGYDLERFRPQPRQRDGYVIGHVGRWDWTKDHANFLAALALVPEAKGVLVGRNMDGNNADLMALVRQHGLEGRVKLLGYRADVESVMPEFDVLCLSSRTESMPNAVCESMACGVPCVVTNVGDAAEIVGDTGIVVPPENPEALAAGLREMLARDRVALGRAARDRVSRLYDRKKMVESCRSLYGGLGWA